MRDFLEHIAVSIRSAVRPWVVDLRGRGVVGKAAGGDATFEVDRVAERRLEAILRRSGRSLLCYSEDRGLVTVGAGEPEMLLIVDPIDGTRNARSGFEGCMVSVACAAGPLPGSAEGLTLGDMTHAALAEIVGRRVFYAERGGGAEWREGGRRFRPRLSGETELDGMTWSLGIVGRPAGLLFEAMGELVDRTSLKAGFFSCNSIAYSLTRLVTGQLDAALDVANRIYRDRPETRQAFVEAGGGSVMGLCPYDIAAAVLVAQEAGCAISDAYGEPLDSAPALASGSDSLRSCVAAGNTALHERLLAYVDAHLAV